MNNIEDFKETVRQLIKENKPTELYRVVKQDTYPFLKLIFEDAYFYIIEIDGKYYSVCPQAIERINEIQLKIKSTINYLPFKSEEIVVDVNDNRWKEFFLKNGQHHQ